MSTCQLCGASGLTWHENLRALVNEITGQRHGYGSCMIKVPRFRMDNGVAYPRKDDYLARDVVDAAVKLRLKPDARPVRDGDWLILKKR